MSDNNVEVFCRVSAYAPDSGTDSDSNTATLTVVQEPAVITTQPVTVNLTEPAGHTFTVAATHAGGSPISYFWQARARNSSDAWSDASTLYSNAGTSGSANFTLNRTVPADNDLELKVDVRVYGGTVVTASNIVYANVEEAEGTAPVWLPLPDINHEYGEFYGIHLAEYVDDRGLSVDFVEMDLPDGFYLDDDLLYVDDDGTGPIPDSYDLTNTILAVSSGGSNPIPSLNWEVELPEEIIFITEQPISFQVDEPLSGAFTTEAENLIVGLPIQSEWQGRVRDSADAWGDPLALYSDASISGTGVRTTLTLNTTVLADTNVEVRCRFLDTTYNTEEFTNVVFSNVVEPEEEEEDFDSIEGLKLYYNTHVPGTVETEGLDEVVAINTMPTSGDTLQLIKEDHDETLLFNAKVGLLDGIEDSLRISPGLQGVMNPPLDTSAETGGYTVLYVGQHREYNGNSNAFMIYDNPDYTGEHNRVFQFSNRVDGRVNNVTLTTTQPISLGVPTVMVLSWDTDAGVAELDIDGTVTSENITPPRLPAIYGMQFMGNCNGIFAIGCVWNRTLSTQEIDKAKSIAQAWITTGTPSGGVEVEITLQPTDLSIPMGAPAAFVITVTGTEPITYYWEAFNGVDWVDADTWFSNTTGQGTRAYSAFDTTIPESCDIRVTVDNNFGDAVVSDVVSLEITAAVAGDGAILLFTDMLVAPNIGWDPVEDPDHGACISIYGQNLGNGRPAGTYVTINGYDLVDDDYYVEAWGAPSASPLVQRITVQLDNRVPLGTGLITVTTGGETSNGLSFTVTDTGRIRFIDLNYSGESDGTFNKPWKSPRAYMTSTDPLRPGDIWYHRGGLYQEIYGTASSMLYLSGRAEGTQAQPIALIGYPGETVIFDGITNEVELGILTGITSLGRYYTISKIHIDAPLGAISTRDGTHADNLGWNRVIDCDLSACKTYGTGTGILVFSSNGGVGYGLNIHGARTDEKLDHGSYFSGNPTRQGQVVAYSYYHDCTVDNGAIVSMNQQPPRVEDGYFVREHRLHNNVIDSRSLVPGSQLSYTRPIQTHSYGESGFWGDGSQWNYEPMKIFGNIIIMGEEEFVNPIGAFSGNSPAYWAHNTILGPNGGGTGGMMYDWRPDYSPETTRTIFHYCVNNVIIRRPDATQPAARNNFPEESRDNGVVFDTNCFNGGGSNLVEGINDNPILGDAEIIWVDDGSLQFELGPTSSLIGQAIPWDLTDFMEVRADINGRRWGDRPLDVGAIKYEEE